MRRLQVKLTVSYTVITVATLVTLLLIVVAAVNEVVASRLPDIVVQGLGQRAPQAAVYLAQDPPDAAGARSWLGRIGGSVVESEVSTRPRIAFDVMSSGGVTALVDRHGTVIAASGSLPPAAAPLLRAALAGEGGAVRLPDGSIAGAWPVRGPDGAVVGALASHETGLSQAAVLVQSLVLTAVLAVPVAPVAALVGTVFGFLVARATTRRYRRVAETVGRWSRGDLEPRIRDRSRDEFAAFTGQLDHMADRLRSLLEAQRELAVHEERQRIARDLHDSVKQQVFAISTLVSSSRDLLPHDVTGAVVCLADVDALVAELQREMAALVQAMWPRPLDGQPLDEALRRLADRWSSRCGIAATVSLEPVADCPPAVSEAVFRVGQEALANVARHSGASRVRLALAGCDGALTLTVEDDGIGLAQSAETSGLGMRSMGERMRAVGGTLTVAGRDGAGTVVTATWRRDPGGGER